MPFKKKLLISFLSAAACALVVPLISLAQNLMVIEYQYVDEATPGKSFKMQVPANWEVKENFGGYALFMEPKEKAKATIESPIAADPNISVAVVADPRFIDEQSLADYAVEIERKFKQTNGQDIEFNIFGKHLLTDLPGGKRALMYYLTYVNNGVDVGSTILLMSNSKYMYRVTYTDYRVNYEKNFETFFPVMSSLEIIGSPPEREHFLIPMLPYLGVVLGIVLVFYILRKRKEREMNALLRNADSAVD